MFLCLIILAMSSLIQIRQNINLLRELPYYGQNITLSHGQFNNLIPFNDLPTKKYLERLPSLHDIGLFSLNLDKNSDSESTPFHPICCKYYSPHSFYQSKDNINRQSNTQQFSLVHSNIQSQALS